jgi:DNA polymerase III subunit epsilon
VKEQLKARGYKWETKGSFWWREVYQPDREAEEWWLAANIYAVSANPRRIGPEWIERNWRTRHA